MRKNATILYILSFISLALVSCVREINEKGGSMSERAIKLTAENYEVVLTRSQDNTPVSDMVFLGMLDSDSLFLNVTEEVNTDAPVTKSGSSQPSTFSIIAFLDNAQTPYLNTVISSNDNWQTYSPTLYWPIHYENVHFFASTPNKNNELFIPTYTFQNSSFKVDFDYTVRSGDEDNDSQLQPDVIYAIAPNQTEANAPVNLSFIHLLSSVEFRAGDMGDVESPEIVVEISDVISKGHCSITHPVSVENVKWNITNDTDTYSQYLELNKSFNLIPQTLTDTDASFKITIKVADIVHEFSGNLFGAITAKWEASKKYIYTITKHDEVKVSVTDNNTETEISGVKIRNTGFTTSYIRATVVGYWYVDRDGQEEVVSSWDINDDQTGILKKADDWSTYWKEIDGVYYYLIPVEPSEYTKPLFDNYELVKTLGPVSGSKLKVSVVTQAVEQDKVGEVWPDFLNQ